MVYPRCEVRGCGNQGVHEIGAFHLCNDHYRAFNPQIGGQTAEDERKFGRPKGGFKESQNTKGFLY
jgi:hypothetical protein